MLFIIQLFNNEEFAKIIYIEVYFIYLITGDRFKKIMVIVNIFLSIRKKMFFII